KAKFPNALLSVTYGFSLLKILTPGVPKLPESALTPYPRGAQLSTSFHKYTNVLFITGAPTLLCCCLEGADLARKSPYKIILTKQEREELERRANRYTLPYCTVTRAKMMLLAQQGLSNDQ